MKARKASNFERNVIVAMIGLGMVVIVLGVCSFLQFTKPYAVSKDGTKVEQPWVVKIGDNESFVVASESDGEDVIEQVKNAYSTDNTQPESTTLSPEITIEEKELERGNDEVSLTDTEDAVAQVVMANETEEPIVTVRTVEQVANTKAIDFKTEYEKTDALAEGETKVVQKGKKGKKTVVSQVVKENGDTVSREVLSSAVEEEPVNKIVQEGTEENAEDLQGDAPVAVAAAGESEGQVAANADSSGNSTSDEGTSAQSDKKDKSQSNAKKNEDSSGDSSSNDASKSEDNSDTTAKSSSTGQDVVDYALQFVGNPYVYGGSSLTNGTDCSGFTMSVYKKFGISLPHSSSAQRSCGKKVSYSNAKPGDLICYSGHVAIYIGNGKIVHASTPSTGIKISKATYTNILTVRRLL